MHRIIRGQIAVPSNFNRSPCYSGVHFGAITGGVNRVGVFGAFGGAGGVSVSHRSIVWEGWDRLRQAGCRCAPRVVVPGIGCRLVGHRGVGVGIGICSL